MTLPVVVHPFAWPLAALSAGVMVWAYTRRSDHSIKLLWWYMVASKADAYRPLLGRHYRFDPKRAATAGRVMFWFLMALLLGFAGISLAVCIGILQNPTQPSPPAFDASKYEIVTEGQTIYARPKVAPTTNGG